MRALKLTACLVLLAAADGSALAASGCGKGMLWPYVRQPGDCLTDDEIRAGQRGVYNGPVNTNPDMSNVKVPETPPATSVEGGSGGGLFSGILGRSRTPASTPAPSPTPVTASVPTPSAPTQSGSLFGEGIMSQNANGAALNGPGFSFPPTQRGGEAPCAKGWLWPFVRSPGDCLTEAERQNGETGVFRADQVVATAAPAAGPTATQVAASGNAAPNRTEAPPANTEPQCRKGWLWPFVRRPGDCPTGIEQRQGK